MLTIKEIYESRLKIPSDINEHIPTLYKYAQECDSIVELGTRTGNSTIAFLYGLKKCAWLKSYDNWSESGNITNEIIEIANIAKLENKDYEVITADDLQIEIPECDLLWIDTFHVEKQLTAELTLHASKAKKYIIFHDTIIAGLFAEGYPQQNKGMMYSIIRFLDLHPEWYVKDHFLNNNGLLILAKR